MKNPLWLSAAVCLFALFATAQENALTESQLYKTKFNDYTFLELKKTDANVEKLTKLIEFPLSIREGKGGIGEGWVRYKFDGGLVVGFIDTQSEEYTIGLDYIKANAITLDGVTVKVGESVEALSKVYTTVQLEDKTWAIKFVIDEEYCCPVLVKFNPETDVVTEITYKVNGEKRYSF